MGRSDEELVLSVASGEEDALQALLSRHEDRVCRFLRGRLGSFEDAEEATQDVFLNVLRGARTFRGNGAFLPWLNAIARKVVTDRFRRRPKILPVPLVTDPTGGLEIYERRLLAEEVRAALATLAEPYRRALALKYLAGLSYRSAGRELGLSEKGFETRLLRAKQKLRAALARRGEGSDGLS